jgi:hypothetical protein
MTIGKKSLDAELAPAKVIATYPQERTVDVEMANFQARKSGVIVVNNPGNYSFPAVGDMGLVIGQDTTGYYWIGKIEYGFARKISGETDPATGRKYPLREVADGEAYISNPKNGTGLMLSSSGGFSLLAYIQDGISYIGNKLGTPLRMLQAKARTFQATATNVLLNLGVVVRSIPPTGDSPISYAGQAATEFLVKVQKVIGVVAQTVVKFQLGDIMAEPAASTTGIPEQSTATGGLLKAVLLVNDDAGATELGALRIDNLGGVEIKGTLAIIQDATAIYIGTVLGDLSQPAVKGMDLMAWLNSHQHGTGVGPSGTPLTPAGPTTFNSSKVFLG